nr:hypothetical protein [Paludibacteraceae bacterium]
QTFLCDYYGQQTTAEKNEYEQYKAFVKEQEEKLSEGWMLMCKERENEEIARQRRLRAINALIERLKEGEIKKEKIISNSKPPKREKSKHLGSSHIVKQRQPKLIPSQQKEIDIPIHILRKEILIYLYKYPNSRASAIALAVLGNSEKKRIINQCIFRELQWKVLRDVRQKCYYLSPEGIKIVEEMKLIEPSRAT